MLFLEYPRIIVSIHSHDSEIIGGPDIHLYRAYTHHEDLLMHKLSLALAEEGLTVEHSFKPFACGSHTFDSLLNFRTDVEPHLL